MAREIERVGTPEEEELKRKLEELTVIEAELAEKELELATLTAELQALDSRYIRVVGRRFAELDKLNADIAELLAEHTPDDREAQSAAQEARERAEETARQSGDEKEPAKAESFVPSREIQELYRRLAKKVHPDLAVDEKDRERRTRIMAEVNKAYAEGDIERLEAILEEWEASPDAIEGEDVGSRLVRTIRMIARVKRRLGQIEKEVQALMETELYELKIRIDEAVQEGRDLIEEMAASVDAQIERARARLEELRAA